MAAGVIRLEPERSKRTGQNRNILYNAQFFAGVAQLVEQLICNQPVAGSSPIASSMNLKAFLETEKPFLLLVGH
jgi:hypothetical protein